MKPRFTVECWPHGWLICGPGGMIPLTALSEVQSLFPKTAVMAPGITHHYKASGHPDVVVCIVDAGAKHNTWCTEIVASLATRPPEDRWWRGLDVGASSAAIFAVMAEAPYLKEAAGRFAKGATPADADDFGRCERLLKTFPHWKVRLPEVAVAYPETRWAKLIARWDELEAASAAERTKILSGI